MLHDPRLRFSPRPSKPVRTGTAARLAVATAVVAALATVPGMVTAPAVAAASVSGVVNTYQAVSAVSGTTVTVAGTPRGSGTPFAVGDRVMLIQMTGSSPQVSGSSLGNYDNTTITAVSGSQITLASVARSYTPATQRVQLVRTFYAAGTTTVTGTVTATPWDGTTGGVLAIAGDTLKLDADLNATGTGFTPTLRATSSASAPQSTGPGSTDGRGVAGGASTFGSVVVGTGGGPGGGIGGGGGTNGTGRGGGVAGGATDAATTASAAGVDGGDPHRSTYPYGGSDGAAGGGGGVTGGGGGGGAAGGGGGGGAAGGGAGGTSWESLVAGGGGGTASVGNGADGLPGGDSGTSTSDSRNEGSAGGGGGSYGGGGGAAANFSGGDDGGGGGGGGSWYGGGNGGVGGQAVGSGSDSYTYGAGGSGNAAVSTPIPDSAHYLNLAKPRLMMGGAGGNGSQNSGSSAGGAGGGIVYVDANTITGTGAIRSNGSNGVSPAGGGAHSGSGGGAGGQMRIRAQAINAPLVLAARGGAGGNPTANSYHAGTSGAGGGGGGIWVELANATQQCPASNVPNVTFDLKGGGSGGSITNPKNGARSTRGGDGGNGLPCVSPLQRAQVSVGDYVWYDTDQDGVQDAGEAPVGNVTVRLLDADGVPVATTTTSSAGFYSFKDLAPSTQYQVEFVAPSGKQFTTQDAGSNDAADSDAGTNGRTALFTTPAAGGNSATSPDVPTLDAGIHDVPAPAVTIDKKVKSVQDVNGDNVTDAGDKVTWEFVVQNTGNVTLAGVGVTDALAGAVTCADTTLVAGASTTCTAAVHTITAAEASSGTVHNSATATATPPKGAAVTSTPDATDTPVAPTPKVSVGDYVWKDTDRNGSQDAGEAPIANVTVKLLDKDGNVVGTTTTDANGFYSFVGLAPSTPYQIQFVAPDGKAFTRSNAGADATDSDAGEDGKTSVFTTPASGADSATDPDVSSVDAGLVDEQAPARPDPTVSIGDHVWVDSDKDGVQDQGEAAVAGMTVRLLDKDGAVVASTITDANGFYAFVGLMPSTQYQVQFVAPSGKAFTVQAAGDSRASDSNPGATGRTPLFTTPATGSDSATSPDLPTIDAGIVDVPSRTPGASLSLHKTGTVKDANHSGQVDVGDEISYAFEVENTGTLPVDHLEIDDPMLKASDIAITCPRSSLEAGKKMTCLATTAYLITAADARKREVVNHATVTGSGAAGTTVKDDDATRVEVVEVEVSPGSDDHPSGTSLPDTGGPAFVLLLGGLALVGLGGVVIGLGRSRKRQES